MEHLRPDFNKYNLLNKHEEKQDTFIQPIEEVTEVVETVTEVDVEIKSDGEVIEE